MAVLCRDVQPWMSSFKSYFNEFLGSSHFPPGSQGSRTSARNKLIRAASHANRYDLVILASAAWTFFQDILATPPPFTTSPMSQACCFCARMNFSTASAFPPATMMVMPMPMLKT